MDASAAARKAALDLIASHISTQLAVCPYVVLRMVGGGVGRPWLYGACRKAARAAGLVPFDVLHAGKRSVVVWCRQDDDPNVWLVRGLKELGMIKWTKHADRIITTHMVAPKVGDEKAARAAPINAAKAVRLRAGLQVKVADVEMRWAKLHSNGEWARLREWGDDEEQVVRTAFSVDDVTPGEAAAVAADCIAEQVGTHRSAAACLTRSTYLGCRVGKPVRRFSFKPGSLKARLLEIVTAEGPMTARDLVEGHGISKTSAHKYLGQLVQAGALEYWSVDGDTAFRYGVPGAERAERGPQHADDEPKREAVDATAPTANVPGDMARRALRLAMSTANDDARALAAWAVEAAGLSGLDVLNAALEAAP